MRTVDQKMPAVILVLLLIALLSLLFALGCSHQPILLNTPDKDPGLMSAVVNVYAGPLNHLRGVRASVCPMHPTCSEYSRQALEKYGATRGWVMTVDRLIRCGRDEIRLAPRIWVNGQIKFHDPVENNIPGEPEHY